MAPGRQRFRPLKEVARIEQQMEELHAQHWTRQQAIDYGIPLSEVERYVVWPGQACAYKHRSLLFCRATGY